jgi:hypothetical protein
MQGGSFMAANGKTISDSVRRITRNALAGGRLDRDAVRRVTGQAMGVVREAAAKGPEARQDLAHARRNLAELERLFLKTLRETATAGREAASQGMNATLASGAMVARVASGMLAGIADTIAQPKPRRRR